MNAIMFFVRLRIRFGYGLAFFLALVLILGSCVQYKTISIQTLKPAEFSLPKDFIQPLIVAGVYKGVEGSPESIAQAALDSTAAMEACLVLSESLGQSPWFQDLNIPVKPHYRDESSHLIVPYPWSKVEQMAQDYNADLVISLEYIKITPKVDSYPFWDGAMQAYFGSLTMNIYAYWRVYYLYSQKVVGEYLFKDTLTWEEYDYYRVRTGDQLPGFFSASSYCGYVTGVSYAKKIAPSWMDEERLFFSRGTKQMQRAAEFALNNQWIDAATQWQYIIKKYDNRPQVAAKAAFNMAVANEMKGNFEVALEWLDKSQKLYLLPETTWYKRIIEHRIKLLERL
jgi:hypothetical protein